MNLLIADDDTFSRLLLSGTLQKLRHEVSEAENGRQAWELWQKQHFPILISDWLMPDINGLDLTKLIRKAQYSKYTYIIMITVKEGKGNYLEAMDAGVDDFITKPFDEDQLIARLHVAERIINLQTEVKTLSGLLPICAWCKRVRQDDNYWEQVENYFAKHSDAKFSHGICPNCAQNVVETQLQK